jgi:hypothetical protein
MLVTFSDQLHTPMANGSIAMMKLPVLPQKRKQQEDFILPAAEFH